MHYKFWDRSVEDPDLDLSESEICYRIQIRINKFIPDPNIGLFKKNCNQKVK